jgi:amidase
MRMLLGLVVIGGLFEAPVWAQKPAGAEQAGISHAAMDRDLMDVTVERLHGFYRERRYTVAQVVQWHLDRIARYNGIYRAVQTEMAKVALAEAAKEDAEAKRAGFRPGLLWGVPIVVKANTSVAGLVTTDGWIGYMQAGHELVAPRDATIVVRLKKAGAVLWG